MIVESLSVLTTNRPFFATEPFVQHSDDVAVAHADHLASDVPLLRRGRQAQGEKNQ
jgi:hypothetical protein